MPNTTLEAQVTDIQIHKKISQGSSQYPNSVASMPQMNAMFSPAVMPSLGPSPPNGSQLHKDAMKRESGGDNDDSSTSESNGFNLNFKNMDLNQIKAVESFT